MPHWPNEISHFLLFQSRYVSQYAHKDGRMWITGKQYGAPHGVVGRRMRVYYISCRCERKMVNSC